MDQMVSQSIHNESKLIRTARACGLITACIGFIALIGWAKDIPILTAFQSGKIPMAPSTALLFVLYGLALFFNFGQARSKVLKKLFIAVIFMSALAALALLVLSLSGIALKAEHLGFNISGEINGVSLGHMSPVTAACFLISGISFFMLIASDNDRGWRIKTALLSSTCILLIGMLLTESYLLCGHFLYGAVVIPPALTTSLVFLVLGAGLTLWSGLRLWQRDLNTDAADFRFPYAIILIYTVFSICILSSAYFYFHNYKDKFRAAVEKELSAIADQKVSEITQWRKERLGDAQIYYKNNNFSGLVKRYLQDRRDINAEEGLKTWIEKLQGAYDYDRVFLIDAAGSLLLSSPESSETVESHLITDLSEVAVSRKVTFLDFHRDLSDNSIHLAVIIPILDDNKGDLFIGALVLRINPEIYFYPMLKRWPVESNSAETLLVRREGNEVLYLNELKFNKDSALNLRFPLDRTELPAVQAITGRSGIVEGKDYRGVDVIACVKAMPDSTWFMVARMDVAEVYAPLKEQIWMLIVLLGALLLGAGTGTALIWRQQHLQTYKERYEAAEAAKSAEKRYRETLDKMLEGCQIVGFDWTYLYVNDAAAKHGRQAKEDLIGHSIMDVYPGIDKTDMFASLKRCMQDRITNVIENEFVYSDGKKRFFELNIQPVPEGIFVLSIDITERKRAEMEQTVMVEVLELINESDNWEILLKSLIVYIKKLSHCEAVGIRLKDGTDYPYYVTSGFSDEFVRMENRLCTYDKNGSANLDEHDNPVLECMCGNILLGRFDPSKSFFTTDGSFWSNCTTDLLAATSDADRQTRTRNRCNSVGYESVALIPLRSGRETFGLIQFNDKEKGRFSPELIALYRRIADHIANFLAKKQAEERERHLNAILRAIRGVNQLITRERDKVHLVRKSCDILTSTRSIRSAWIVLLDENGKFGSFAESGLKELSFPLKSVFERGSFPKCAKTAMSGPEVIVIKDVFIECANCAMASIYQGNAAFCVRLGKDGNIYGIFSVSVPKAFAEDPQEQTLFKEIADDISFALYNIELEEKRSRVEKDLKDSEIRYRTLFESASEGILITEIMTKKFSYANPALFNMLGYTEDELKEKTIADLHSKDTVDKINYEFNTHYNSGQPMTQQNIPFIKKDGTILYADVLTTPKIVINGELYTATFLMDVTEKKRAEDEKSQLQEQLWQAQKMESIGRLSGGIAHDFNNILTVIIGNAEMACMRIAKEDPLRELINNIREAGQNAANLTHQILAFSRKQVFQTEVLSLNDIVTEVTKMLRRLISEGIDLEIVLAQNPGLVETDRGQMVQVIMNLVVNARDAMSKGGKLIIETGSVELDAGYAKSHFPVVPGFYEMLSISDTGAGMSKEIQSHIFEPFYTTKNIGKGTGLGLSIVYGIVKQSNGYIWVYSEPGKGTTFKIYLPKSSKADHGIWMSKKKLPENLKGSETIMVVEDDGMIMKMIRIVLEGCGYKVLSATNGLEAMDIADKHQDIIHLLFTDVIMPNMGGRDLAKRLSEKRPHVKVLYMSGYTDNAIVHQGVLEKGLSFIQKPFTPNWLMQKVREVLDGTPSGTSRV